MTWVTNNPRTILNWWPRRAGVRYREGPPKETHAHTREELEGMGLVGIYIEDMTLEAYRKLPMVSSPKELARAEHQLRMRERRSS